jgi:S-adenosylmethionine uptake transporter
VAGIAALCALDATVKELTRSYSVAYAVLGRYVFGTVFALAVWWWQGRPTLTRDMLPAHLTRGVLIAATAVLFFFSLTRLGLAEAITLSFIAPLLIPPLAHLFLGERMRGPVLLAALLGFAGVLITVQGAPSFDGDRGFGLAANLGAALTYALAAIVMRARAAKDGSTLLTLTSAVIPMVVLSPAAVGAPLPTAWALGWPCSPGSWATSASSCWPAPTRQRRRRRSACSSSPRCRGRRSSAGCSSARPCGRRCGSARR